MWVARSPPVLFGRDATCQPGQSSSSPWRPPRVQRSGISHVELWLNREGKSERELSKRNQGCREGGLKSPRREAQGKEGGFSSSAPPPCRPSLHFCCCLSLKLRSERIYMPVPPVLAAGLRGWQAVGNGDESARHTRSFIYLRHLGWKRGWNRGEGRKHPQRR